MFIRANGDIEGFRMGTKKVSKRTSMPCDGPPHLVIYVLKGQTQGKLHGRVISRYGCKKKLNS